MRECEMVRMTNGQNARTPFLALLIPMELGARTHRLSANDAWNFLSRVRFPFETAMPLFHHRWVLLLRMNDTMRLRRPVFTPAHSRFLTICCARMKHRAKQREPCYDSLMDLRIKKCARWRSQSCFVRQCF